MTTTLRPTEPLQHAADGTRSRRYQVCVNSRPVGTIHLGTLPGFGGTVAAVHDLRVDEADRRRGRATVAALAAEEVARTWGCRQLAATVPAGAEAALRLVEALGYVPRSRNMEKRLGDTPPALPAGSGPRPMTREEFADWREYGTEQFARAWAQRGIPEEVARERSRRDNEVLLPQGPDTEDMRFSVVEHEGRPVGTLWLALRAQDAYIYDVEVYAAHRGRGHGRTLMLVAEAQTIASGRRLLGLNVFADNTPAERLYESLGYETTRYNSYKPLL